MANILVVDDEMGIRELLNEILSDEGHVVYSAENAQQARTVRDQLQPDLVLLDIWMPDTDGVTLLKEWAKDNKLTMPVIMMSGHATIDTAVEATRIGACNFLEKPIALQKLLKTVAQALERLSPKDVVGAGNNGVREFSTSASGGLIGQGKHQDLGTELSHLSTPSIDIKELTPGHFDLPLREARDIFEKAYFEHHLKLTGGSMTRVSEHTGLERTHLYRKLKALGIDVRKIGTSST
jgi:DNA-binding NtrC family response regulator